MSESQMDALLTTLDKWQLVRSGLYTWRSISKNDDGTVTVTWGTENGQSLVVRSSLDCVKVTFRGTLAEVLGATLNDQGDVT